MNLGFCLQKTSKKKNTTKKPKRGISKGKAGKKCTRKRVSEKISLGGGERRRLTMRIKLGRYVFV